nr:RagB/SusD family nutrient uptake outer membrane protein [uncultured Flavobacterium sp.]
MRTFKKYIISSAILSLALTGVSCSDDQVLDLKPINSIDESTAFSTPALIQASVNGMYQAAQVGYYTGSGRGYVWGAAYTQQNDMRGEDGVNTAAFYQITYQASYDGNSANNVYYWVDGYRLINRCNLVIEGVANAVNAGIIDQATGDDYIGQAKFLRAITHFELLVHFARPYQDNPTTNLGVPYRDYAINNSSAVDLAFNDGRLTVAESYIRVLEDLDDAENMISETALYKGTRNAAIAFKARVKLHKADWPGVLTEIAKIESSYSLTATPSGVFDNNSTNTESIFSIQHSPAVNPGVNAALASQYKRRMLVAISPIIWNDPEWLVDDLRRNETTDSGSSDDTGNIVYSSAGVKYSNKYRDTSTYSDNTPIIRFAEVLLMKAEAEARVANSVTTDALNALNAVRNRALSNPDSQGYTLASFSSAADFVQKVIKERRIEFLLEGRRWADIHRLQNDALAPINGIPAKLANGAIPSDSYTPGTPYTGELGTPAIPYSNYRFVWPLPILETSVNPVLAEQQNPGY